MKYEKTSVILTGRGFGLLKLERISKGVDITLTLYIPYKKGRVLGVFTDGKCIVRDISSKTLECRVDDCSISDIHAAVVEEGAVILYGTTGKTRMWDANVLQAMRQNDTLKSSALNTVLPEGITPSLEHKSIGEITYSANENAKLNELNSVNFYEGLDLNPPRVDIFLDGDRVTQLDNDTDLGLDLIAEADKSADESFDSEIIVDNDNIQETAIEQKGESESEQSIEDAIQGNSRDTVNEQKVMPNQARRSKTNIDKVQNQAEKSISANKTADEKNAQNKFVKAIEQDAKAQFEDEPCLGSMLNQPLVSAVSKGKNKGFEDFEPLFKGADNDGKVFAIDERFITGVGMDNKIDNDCVSEESAAHAELPYLSEVRFLSEYFACPELKVPLKPVYPLKKTPPPVLREATALERNRDDIARLFEICPHIDELENLLEGTVWVRVEVDDNGFVAVGKVNDNICYAVRGSYSQPPASLTGAKWLPLNPERPNETGYWIVA